jgi:hypothetical protein
MNTQRLVLALTAVLLGFALSSAKDASAQKPAIKRGYHARLISPQPGEILTPGQVVRVEWTAEFPDVDVNMCETEVLLSLDGGKTIYMFLNSQRNPKVTHFDWTVPDAPTTAAVLDVRFGCLSLYPETSDLQIRSTFVIRARTADDSK